MSSIPVVYLWKCHLSWEHDDQPWSTIPLWGHLVLQTQRRPWTGGCHVSSPRRLDNKLPKVNQYNSIIYSYHHSIWFQSYLNGPSVEQANNLQISWRRPMTPTCTAIEFALLFTCQQPSQTSLLHIVVHPGTEDLTRVAKKNIQMGYECFLK